ncbi:NAD-dependent epimerase/dehydratase family protein [Riemerella anatipestifer]|uniref:NAD-dependent epimerase/dehydratase family protein n=1 Tax=Riemerella anatipestifer TaxID=34085 RepID=UPI00129D3FE1|nr:NAD-dependent epimerase/dehydratase family protein [Riemerella anatipestifer]MDY3389968.1 NAD-dependent epimerase/dehydratase family protein [Riemerella anatipestifer]MDY3517950.1 NAD-dependent epimerase/dehydratase family protein [Riemerella anatipestifer]MDY3542936.1 NAD-dependent epimerase/dehydratase family protein [Riemerella anatipestifer]WJR88248.1 N-acetyl-alpha-D-glucosaminyl-diphospho-ditrans,octacis-undecaprenol 4-epimerase [Riemerella anatipestifer]
MKTIITGASGFVGTNLSNYLVSKGFEVEQLPLRTANFKLDDTATSIIHLAGKAHDIANTSSESEYYEVNTELTKKVFDAFLSSSVCDFFFFSSVKAVADIVEGTLCEDTRPNPQTPYGKSKLAAEAYLLAQALPKGKRLFIIRSAMIHGAGNKGNLNLLYKVVKKGIPWPLASFTNERSFLSIDNLNYLIEQMLTKKDVTSGVYNFSDDEYISTNQLITIIAHSSNKKSRLWAIPPFLFKGIAKAGDVLKLPINSERLKKLTESYRVSNQKIKSALGIEKLPYTAEEGLIKTIKSFQNKK